MEGECLVEMRLLSAPALANLEQHDRTRPGGGKKKDQRTVRTTYLMT